MTDSEFTHSPNTPTAKRFFAYYWAKTEAEIERQREDCAALVVRLNGVITADAADIGPGPVVDPPGYARLYDAIDLAKVDAFVTDMTDFGPTLILGLYAMCVVNAVEMWDLKTGRITDIHIKASADVFRDRLEKSTENSDQLIRGILNRPTWLS
jgi:hypothetical protein